MGFIERVTGSERRDCFRADNSISLYTRQSDFPQAAITEYQQIREIQGLALPVVRVRAG